jgi:methylated-DNA-[protein]-cysteine S-methyltransferase
MNKITPPKQIEDRLRATPAIDGETWRRVGVDLAQRAEAEGLVDVAYERHESPLGSIVLAATHDGLVRVGLPIEGEDAVLDELARRISGRVLRAPRSEVTVARRQLEEYFERRRTEFDVTLDWQLTGGFRRQVLAATAKIPYGQTASYTDVATRAGSPRAVRAAGTALATNPLPIVIPCHRVLKSSGQLGSYRGGPQAKAQLVEFERGAASATPIQAVRSGIS